MRLQHHNSIVLLLLCAALVPALAGCTLPIRRAPLPLPDNHDAYINDVLQRPPLPEEITFLSLITVSSGRGGTKSKNVIKLKLPDKIRIETLGFMGHPAVLTTSDGTKVTVTLLTEQRQYVGAADPESIARIFGVAMPLRTITHIIIGAPILETPGAVCEQENMLYRCRIATDNATATLLINPDRRMLLHYDYVSERIPARYAVSYAEFKKAAGRMLPHRVVISNPDTGKTVTIRHLAVSNEPITDAAFQQQTFPGAAFFPLEALQELW